VYSAPSRFSNAISWYAACIASWMLTMLTAPGLTLLFLGVVVGLGTAFVWMLWEVEQTSKPHRNSDRFGQL
jgi:predicted negative regulator of RcsB-dependent stress response